ncbi:MAG TPA: hypothetical protein VG126_10390 [Thermoleophilaceae bacterium]|nr:hypothetical protein [Thermoleophilaceae bacterium]
MTNDLFSGDAGDVTHPWRRAKRTLGEAAFSAIDAALLTGARVDRLARALPGRRVLVTGVYRPDSLLSRALPRLSSNQHDVTFAFGAVTTAEEALVQHTVAEGLSGGKFENLNAVLAAAGRPSGPAGSSGGPTANPSGPTASPSGRPTASPSGPTASPSGPTASPSARGGVPSGSSAPAGAPSSSAREPGRPPAAASESGDAPPTTPAHDFDWILVVDDDLLLPPRFLDRFIALCERFALDMAQPAQTLRSHSAWRVTRRRPASLVRETRFVEIGPLTAFARCAAAELLPFPELRFGWGLDLHWAAVAADSGWRLGVVDATPVRHESATVGSAYPRTDAEAEAADFLSSRPYLPASRANEVIAVHRRAGTTRAAAGAPAPERRPRR